MKKHRLAIALSLLILASCGRTPESPSPEATAPFPVADPTLMPVSELSITVKIPAGTSPGAEIGLVVLDEVSGWPYNQTLYPLEEISDDLWGTQLLLPARTLLRYRYVRLSPTVGSEAYSDGSPISSRVVHISGATRLDDVIAAWNDQAYQGPVGRILGRLIDADTGAPLPDMIATVGGRLVFTDSAGEFRVDGLAPGQHTITAFSPLGEFSPAQQAAVIAADSSTPAEMALHRAKLVQVTFEVTVPDDTIEGTQIRMAGNLEQLGHFFTQLPGGQTNSIGQMPTLIEVDATHYVKILNLYEGTDLRYKYTLGDGLINAERDSDGKALTREVIIPDQDIVIRDAVSQWQGDRPGAQFWVTVPEITPANEVISLQLGSYPPIPMWRIGDYEWFYAMHNFPEFGGPIAYRYCRNQLCGSADDAQTTNFNPNGRTFSPGSTQVDLRDSVDTWAWWGSDARTSLGPPDISPKTDMEVGVELLPAYNPDWETFLQSGLEAVADLQANTVILSPAWLVAGANPTPVVGFDPAYSPYRERLITTINYARSLGLEVVLHPRLVFQNRDPDLWWTQASLDEGWWTTWYERYGSFIEYYADVAAESGATKLILGGAEVAPSLPGGLLPDGTPSNAPLNAETRWREFIAQLRSTYSGRLSLELDFGYALQIPPDFIDQFDEIQINWHSPLALDAQAGLPEYIAQAHEQFASSISSSGAIGGMPITVSVEYPSVDGSARGCLPDTAGCTPARAYDLGADPDPLAAVDMAEQAAAIDAVFTEAYAQSTIRGLFVRRYNPFVELQDKSASVNGKEAYNLVKGWFLAIRGLVP